MYNYNVTNVNGLVCVSVQVCTSMTGIINNVAA